MTRRLKIAVRGRSSEAVTRGNLARNLCPVGILESEKLAIAEVQNIALFRLFLQKS
jgi:hypothetical protein